MISGLIFNIMGIMNNSSIRRMKKLIKSHRLFFFAIIEPKAYSGDIQDFQRLFSCSGIYRNDKGSIWLFWKSDIQVQVVFSTDQFILVELSHLTLTCSALMSIVYGSCDGM